MRFYNGVTQPDAGLLEATGDIGRQLLGATTDSEGREAPDGIDWPIREWAELPRTGRGPGRSHGRGLIRTLARQDAMYLKHMRPHQLREAVERCDPLLVPAGCIETHGPHMAIGHDTIIVEEICALVAERT